MADVLASAAIREIKHVIKRSLCEIRDKILLLLVPIVTLYLNYRFAPNNALKILLTYEPFVVTNDSVVLKTL